MSTPSSSVSHTADRIEYVAEQSGLEKQKGNTRALLFQNMPLARETRSIVGGGLGLLESFGDTLFRTLTLAARPQDLKNTDEIIRNGVKTIIAEKPQVATQGGIEYVQNLRAPKVIRDFGKSFHDPYIAKTQFYDTHDTSSSFAPDKNDKWYSRFTKGALFVAGKTLKAPLRALAGTVATLTDTVRRMKGQKMRDLVSLQCNKTDRGKTKFSRKKLFSWSYKGKPSENSTLAKTNLNQTTSSESAVTASPTAESTLPTTIQKKKSFWSRLWPFHKKQKTSSSHTGSDIPAPKEGGTQVTKPENISLPNKEQAKQSQIALGTFLSSGILTAQALEQAFNNKDRKSLEQHSQKLTEDVEFLNDHIGAKDLDNEDKSKREIITTTYKKLKKGQFNLKSSDLDHTTKDNNKQINHKNKTTPLQAEDIQDGFQEGGLHTPGAKTTDKTTQKQSQEINKEKEIIKDINLNSSLALLRKNITSLQKELTDLYNKEKTIDSTQTNRLVTMLQQYLKAQGKVVYTKDQDNIGDLQNITVENGMVTIHFTDDKNKKHRDTIALDELVKYSDQGFYLHDEGSQKSIGQAA